MKKQIFYYLFPMFLLWAGCSDHHEMIDTEYPEILLHQDAFPIQCSTINKGETFTFRAFFHDNVQLGSYSLDIHHNFDHHTHSTEVEECDLDRIKVPEKPFLFIRNYPIPEGLREYPASTEIEVPEDIDSGDYHLMIRVTDKEGWQTMIGLSIKIE
ncbi:DUF4625 domain-containing protein [Anditalea andensis]|uniref:DUF4625 domain-containing protein n=1 Tax=Anditalea andensis TaxID=1048983 RepID=A0A074L2Q7_9BACT|nr:DUF4625 domain-containing protein [Anditalea andensis]KEO75474.1 hypothetical protein EL17_01070 [Anditalea andensis]